VFTGLLEKLNQVNEVNIPARLAADDLISSFADAYHSWEDTYRYQLSADEFRLTMKMVRSTPFRTFIGKRGNN